MIEWSTELGVHLRLVIAFTGRHMALLRLATMLLPALPAQAAYAQDPMPLTRLSGPVVLDGLSDEPAWELVPTLPLVVYQPTFGMPPTERTEIRIAYDDEYLYVAGRMYDSNPAEVRVYSLYRDGAFSDDLFAIILDTYNDHETALWFTTNPAGVRSDRTISNDAEFTGGGDARRLLNSDWNTFWDVATQRNDEGWFAEMRIPFSSLGFQDVDGRVVMGLTAYRWITRRQERHLFPAIPPNWNFGFAKPSQAQRVSLEGVHSSRPVYITPYALGGLTRAPELNGNQSAYDFHNDVTNEIGLDVKYNATNNLTLDLTVNTDFAQVEVDDQQINLTRFSLFFPEKRQFFQERAAIFEFATGGLGRLFHSRRIGLNQGEPIRILGGARLVGRIGNTDLGMLNMQTAGENGLPYENFGVVRVRQKVFNSFSNVGAMATTRFADDGTYNVAVGADAIFRPFGDEYFTLKWIRTFDDVDAPGTSFFDASRFLVLWQRRNDNGFGYAGEFVRSGIAYDAGVGFQLRNDFTFINNELKYQWFLGSTSPFRTISIENMAQAYVRNGDESVESASIKPSFKMEFKTGARVELSLNSSYESVLVPFVIPGGPNIPSGNYWFHEGKLRYQLPRGGTKSGDISLGAGSFYDGWRMNLSAAPEWRISPHLTLGTDYELNIIRFSERNESLDAHLVRFRVRAALDIHFSASTFAQYNSAADELSMNARLRYHFSEGNDLWLVYNEGFNTEREVLMGPRLPFSQNRTFMLKYTYTFIR